MDGWNFENITNSAKLWLGLRLSLKKKVSSPILSLKKVSTPATHTYFCLSHVYYCANTVPWGSFDIVFEIPYICVIVQHLLGFSGNFMSVKLVIEESCKLTLSTFCGVVNFACGLLCLYYD